MAAPLRRLRNDVFLMLAARVIILGAGAAQSIVLARALGTDGRGVLAVAFSFSLMLTQFGTLGLTTASPYFAAREPDALGRLVANALWFAAGMGGLLILVGAGMKAVAPGSVEGVAWPELLVALVGIPAAIAAQLLQGALLGEGRTVAYNVGDIILALLPLIALTVGALAYELDVLTALIILIGGQILTALFYLALLMRHAPAVRQPDLDLAKRMLRYGLKAYLALLLAYLLIRFDLLLINGYLGKDQAGIYSVVIALADMLYLLPAAVAINLFPRLAGGASHEMTAEVFRSIAVLFGIVCLVSMAFAAPAIELLYGGRFASAAISYYWIVPGIFSLGMLNILSYHFAARGFPREVIFAWLAGLVANLAINIAFLPGHGTYIAAVASSVSYGLVLFLHMRMFAREAGGYGDLRPRLRETARFLRHSVTRSPA